MLCCCRNDGCGGLLTPYSDKRTWTQSGLHAHTQCCTCVLSLPLKDPPRIPERATTTFLCLPEPLAHPSSLSPLGVASCSLFIVCTCDWMGILGRADSSLTKKAAVEAKSEPHCQLCCTGWGVPRSFQIAWKCLILVAVVVVIITLIIIAFSSLLGLSSFRNIRNGSWIHGRASPAQQLACSGVWRATHLLAA